jgi:indoleamine 2,3-dioxygenase
MPDYMPPGHRRFVLELESLHIDRSFYASSPTLKELYNQCVHWVERFRTKHLEYAAQYIARQHQMSAANPTEVGTGGTPFMPYLAKHRDETQAHKLA